MVLFQHLQTMGHCGQDRVGRESGAVPYANALQLLCCLGPESSLEFESEHLGDDARESDQPWVRLEVRQTVQVVYWAWEL